MALESDRLLREINNIVHGSRWLKPGSGTGLLAFKVTQRLAIKLYKKKRSEEVTENYRPALGIKKSRVLWV